VLFLFFVFFPPSLFLTSEEDSGAAMNILFFFDTCAVKERISLPLSFSSPSLPQWVALNPFLILVLFPLFLSPVIIVETKANSFFFLDKEFN